MISVLQSKDTEWQFGLEKKTQPFFCLQEMQFTSKEKHKLRVKGWKTDFLSK
jgi:hypothetical protein